MTLHEIATKLVENCRKGRAKDGLDELYADTAESVEAFDQPGSDQNRITRGIEGIRAKHDWWEQSFDEHSVDVEGPYLHGPDRFAVIFAMDVTEKQSGQRMQMREVAIYTVEEQQIVKEEFYMAPQGG